MSDTIVYDGKRYVWLTAPRVYNGKQITFQEVLRSTSQADTIQEAERNLNHIRENHSEKNGWIEFDAWIERHGNKYIACRYHANYR